MPKKKTRKQKEKARERRVRQLTQSQSTDKNDSTNNYHSPINIPLDSNKKDASTPGNKYQKTDLRKTLILLVIIIIIFIIFIITENQYNYLSPTSRNIMNYLLQR